MSAVTKTNWAIARENTAPIKLHERGERGQMLVMLAILIPVLLGVVAMGVDISVFYWTWSRMQSAADSAVLAGSASLPNSSSLAIAAATAYAKTNGMLASEITSTTVAANKLSISIKLTRVIPYYFASVLGLVNSPVVVNATASLLTAGSATGTLPIGLSVQTPYVYGQTIVIHQAGAGNGNWGGLALGCTGGACYSNNLANGYSGTITIGNSVPTELLSEPGAKAGPTSAGIDGRVAAGMAADPGGTWSDHTLTDPRVGIVPVVDWTGCSGRCQIPVEAFAALWIVGASGSDITVVFIGAVPAGSVPINPVANYGTYRSVLSQ